MTFIQQVSRVSDQMLPNIDLAGAVHDFRKVADGLGR
jgi:hypothetical protein